MPDVTPALKAKKRKKPGQSTIANKNAATRLHSQIVRARGYCEYGDFAPWLNTECSGDLECAHVVRRGASGVRTDLDNARCLCRKHHTWLDQNPQEWVAWVGLEEYRRLRAKADAYTRGELGSPLLFWRAERARLSAIWEQMK